MSPSAAPPGVYGLVVDPNPSLPEPRGYCVATQVADVCPPNALTLGDSADPRDLALTVARGVEPGRGERPRMAFLTSAQSRLRDAGRPVSGGSARLPLALSVIGDLYGLVATADVYATGSLNALDGRVAAVGSVAAKLHAIVRRVKSGPQPRPVRVLIPAQRWLAAEPEPARHAADDAVAALIDAGVEVRSVSTLAEAARLTFGQEFGLTERLGPRRAQLRANIYDARKYAALVRDADELRAELDARGDTSLAGAVMRLEAVAIAAWAASRLCEPVPYRGVIVDAAVAAERYEAEQRALLAQGQVALWPETRALVENLRAATHFGRSLHFALGERMVNDALRIPGVVEGPIGEHRKLLGTRAQFRWRRGLRERARGASADAALHFDGAVTDARQAYRLANHPEVAACNDRARVAVYLANALLCRGARADIDEARTLLEQQLGLPVEERGGQASQDPGWAFLVYAWLRVREDPASLWRSWPRCSDTLTFGGRSLAQRLADRANPLYHEALAATLAYSALAAGDTSAAATWTSYASDEPNLCSLVSWWPLLALPAAQTPNLDAHRAARASRFETGVDRPQGPCCDAYVSGLLAALAAPDAATSTQAWVALTRWVGRPALPGAVAPR